jgi:pre-mRNA-processing factor 40
LTKNSVWEKPFELMTLNEKADSMTPWREHIAPNGKIFFFNQNTNESQWQIPDEVKTSNIHMKHKLFCSKMPHMNTIVSQYKHKTVKTILGINSKNKSSVFVTWNDKESAKDAFKQMLDDLGVHWRATWEQALRLIINDFRFNNAIKSINERKSVFIEWSKFKEEQERE